MFIKSAIFDYHYQGSKDITRKSSMGTTKSSRQHIDYSESEKEESEYETEGEEDEGSPAHGTAEDVEQDYEEEEGHDEEEEEANEESEEEAEVSGSS